MQILIKGIEYSKIIDVFKSSEKIFKHFANALTFEPVLTNSFVILEKKLIVLNLLFQVNKVQEL